MLVVAGRLVILRIELSVKSMNASSGWDVASVTANSERGEQVRISDPYGNVSDNNSTLHE